MAVPDEILTRYDVDSVVSTDEWSTSYRGSDARTRSRALITVLSPDASADAQVRAQFWQTIKLWRPLRHPYVLRLQAAGLNQGSLWIATDQPGVRTLADLIGTSPADLAASISLLRDVAEGLDLLHEAGLLHLDLRPANIWLSDGTTGSHAHLGGLAVNPMAAAVGRLTTTGRAPVSLSYVAPEQLRGEQPGPAADQYSLACILVELLTGEPPYGSGHPLTLIRAHLDAEPPALTGTLPPAGSRVLRRGLAKTPEDRYPTCLDFVEAMLVTLSRKNDMDVVESEPTAPALAVIGGAASGMRFLLSPGHHVVGRGGESDFVVPDLFLSREHVRVVVDDRLVAISDGGSTNGTYVNGERLTAQRTLADNDVVEAGASLFCVRNPPVDDRTPVVPVPGEADADLLMQLGRRDRDRLQRLAANRAGVVVRVGFAASTSGARARPQAITVNIATSLVAIRGTAEARAALARWLLVQAVTTHAPHRLAVAAALGPVPGDIWDWVGTIPHAHAELGVLAGSRVATDRATGAAMLARLRDLVNARRRQTRDVVDGVPAPFVPLVLAFADSSIASGDDVDALAGGRDVQVHVVWLGRPDQTPPIAMETIVDLDGTTGDVVVHHPATGDPAITGIADGLSTDLARQAARDFLRA